MEKCGDTIDFYITVMNDMEAKTEIARVLLSDIVGKDKKYHFLGSYLTFPKENGEKLKEHYVGQNNADLFDNVKNQMKDDFQKMSPQVKYVCFLAGSIVSYNDVNHHVGFIYDKELGILRVMDSGMRCWDSNFAKTVMKLVREVFLINVEVQTYSQKMGCFKKKKNPQDITLGGFLGEFKTYFSSDITRENRERFCQSWSMLLMLTDIERLKNDRFYNISDPYMEYWDKNSSSLEYCIRRFILWVVSKFKKEVFEKFRGYNNTFLKRLEACFRQYIPNIQTPTDQDTICEGISI